MQDDSTRRSPLPPGWARDFFDKADLLASFESLRDCKHFHAETMRGRIRSLEIKIPEAEEHFEKALDLSQREPKTIPNIVRWILLNAYWLEHKILSGSVEGLRETQPLQFPDFPAAAVEEYPEIRLVNHVRLSIEGEIRLHLGSWEVSSAVFRDLIRRCQGEPEDVLAIPYIGLAASDYNLGNRDAALRNLENAGLCMQVGGTTFNRAKVAANLYALYECLGERSQARDWRSFLERLSCPLRTKEIFLKRSEILLERWTESRVLVFL